MRSTILTLASVLWGIGALADDAKGDYELRVKAYKISPEAITGSGQIRGVSLSLQYDEQFSMPLSPEGEPLVDFRRPGGMVLKEAPLWNGKPEPDVSGVVSLGSAQEVIQPNRPARISIEDKRPIQYFKHVRDDLYELQTLEERQGIQLDLTVQPGALQPDPDWMRLEYSVGLTFVSDPEPPVADGPAGGLTWATVPPALVARSQTGAMLVKPGNWFVSVIDLTEVGSVLVLIQMTPVEEK